MGSLGGASHIASQSGSADQNVAYADLAAAVRLTVIACETLYDHAGKLNFAVQEDAVVRNEYAVEDNENFWPPYTLLPTSMSLYSSILRVSQD